MKIMSGVEMIAVVTTSRNSYSAGSPTVYVSIFPSRRNLTEKTLSEKGLT